MWTEVGTWAGMAAIIVGLITLIIKNQNGKIAKMENNVVLREPCKQRHYQIEKDFMRASEERREIKSEMKKHYDLLVKVDKNLAVLAKEETSKRS